MKPGLRNEVFQRAKGACEGRCGRSASEADHFFGRARAESLQTVWALCHVCHRCKTDNRPNATYWLERFASHCSRHGYAAERTRALRRLAFVAAREQLGNNLKRRAAP